MKRVRRFVHILISWTLSLGGLNVSLSQTYRSTQDSYGDRGAFCVVAIRGNVKVERPDGTWTSLKVRDTVSYVQRIWLDDKAYVGLISKSGRAVEIKSNGLVSVNYVTPRNPSESTSKYTGYVLNQAVASGAGRQSGKTLGAVTRSALAPQPKESSGSKYFAENIIFHWNKTYDTTGYVIEILDYYGNVVGKVDVPPHYDSWGVCADDFGLMPGRTYYWRIARRSAPNVLSDPVRFSVCTKNESDKIREELEDLLIRIDEETALGMIMMAAFYEHYDMYAYAIECYETASKIEPNIAWSD